MVFTGTVLNDEVIQQLLKVVESFHPLGFASLCLLLSLLLREDYNFNHFLLLTIMRNNILSIPILRHYPQLLFPSLASSCLQVSPLSVSHFLRLQIISIDREDCFDVDWINLSFFECFYICLPQPHLFIVVISLAHDCLQIFLSHFFSEFRNFLCVKVLQRLSEGVVGCCEQKYQLGLQHLSLVVRWNLLTIWLYAPQMVDYMIHGLMYRQLLHSSFYPDSSH